MNNKRAIIIHGFEGGPTINWFPWLREKLEEHNVQVSVPSMPNAYSPKLNEWLDYLHQIIGEPDENVFLIGHSLGGPAIFRYLEALPMGKKIGGAVVVAGFAESINAQAVENFVTGKWHDEKIKTSSNQITLINADDDPYIPMEMAERMKKRFDAHLIVMRNAQHICEKAGFLQLPEALEDLRKMIKLSSTNV